jgi:hypothetical protein
MNPDGTVNQPPDLTSPPTAPEIIDVRIVEEIASVPTQLGDVWDSGEVSESNLGADTSLLKDNLSSLLDEIEQDISSEPNPVIETLSMADPELVPLLRVEAEIKAEIAKLQTTQTQLEQQIIATQTSFGQIIQTSVTDLEQRRQKLQITVEQLERRRDRIQAEITKSFAGGSQDIAIRLQGFKDYLVGSLQDLVIIAEEIEFPQPPPAQIRIQTPIPQSGGYANAPVPANSPTTRNPNPQFAEPAFKSTAAKVRSSINHGMPQIIMLLPGKSGVPSKLFMPTRFLTGSLPKMAEAQSALWAAAYKISSSPLPLYLHCARSMVTICAHSCWQICPNAWATGAEGFKIVWGYPRPILVAMGGLFCLKTLKL